MPFQDATKRKEYNALHYQKNREQAKIRAQMNYDLNREKICAGKKIYRKKNIDKINEWKEKNHEKIIAQAKIRFNYRYKNDPVFRIKHQCRNRVRDVLKGKRKIAKTFDLIGCSPEQLKIYLENKFTKEMGWKNYGEYWHIDHIIPCASFDLAQPTEQRKCFHFSNLRPLEAIANIKKGARF